MKDVFEHKRKPLIAANWKMNKTVAESTHYVSAFYGDVSENKSVDIVICAPFTALYPVHELTKSMNIKLGGQNVNNMDEGPYTGEVSAKMLKDIGCTFAIVGHSERRMFYEEQNDFINDKIRACFSHGLIPILCVGEMLSEREAQTQFRKVEVQLDECLDKIPKNLAQHVIIAYEPVWAIGTGRAATPEQAEEMHKEIRHILSEKYDIETAKKMRIIYGGSVNPQNMKLLMAKPNIDGALVGGASLNPSDFAKIVNYHK